MTENNNTNNNNNKNSFNNNTTTTTENNNSSTVQNYSQPPAADEWKVNGSTNTNANNINLNNDSSDTTTLTDGNTQIELISNQNYNTKEPLRSILKVKIPKYSPEELRKIEEKENGGKKKKKRRDKSDLGDDFVPPDGGWGWLVAIAAGINIFVTFALAQNFGIIFRGHMKRLGINTAELTTIINIQIAVSAITGLLNGPLFRRFTFRQVAVVGSFLTFFGLFISVFAETFIAYVWAFSCLYGLGRGLTVSASSLAVNTYFKVRRRTATAYQFGVAGLGPIIFPYIATYMLYYFDVEGTVLIFSALSLHTIACSLIYQPVMWHVKKASKDVEAFTEPLPPEEQMETIVEPDTPTLPRANDGWYGSRLSLNSVNGIRRRSGTWEKRRDSDNQMQELRPLNSKEQINSKLRTTSISQSIKEESDGENDYDQRLKEKLKEDDEYIVQHNEKEKEHEEDEEEDTDSDDEHKAFKAKTLEELEREYEREDEERKRLPFHKKIIIFFDLDLLRDFGYLNLSIGITLINFVEINFAILTPFILADFGFGDNQIALAMSSLGFCDLVVRFLVPLITSKMHFSNKTFFIIGITGMCFGRLLLAFTRNFYCMIAIFIWLGLNKAFRTVFWSLIIPGYVPLKRLPAAAGLQLLMSGVFSLACGPLIGFIRDNTSYGFALQFLNVLCISAIIMWVVEELYRKARNKKAEFGLGDAQK